MKKIVSFLLCIVMIFTLVSCSGEVGPQGEQGIPGADGEDGKDGITPTIEISDDGYWVINGVKTEHRAVGENGQDGEDGVDGAPGNDGITPTISISDDGYWVINGVKTDYLAEGQKDDASADSENPQGLDFYLKDDGTYAVAVGKAIYLSKIVIPSTYRGKAVTEVAVGAFYAYEYSEFGFSSPLTEISLPDTITRIGDYAFAYCENLTELIIPSGVTSIGEGAFEGCDNLTIKCEADCQPDGWDPDWNYHDVPVVWHYQREHSWVEATCEAPKHCSICFTSIGEKAHSWVEATCVTPKYCSICSTSIGEPHGHYYEGYICLICGNEAPAPEKVRYDVPAEGYDGSAVTITFSHTMGQALRDVLDEYIVEFNKIYPNITVEHTQVGGYDEVRDQIKQELTAGNQPNIAYCYPDHVALYNLTKKVVPLDNFIESKIVVNSETGEILGLTDEQIANFIDGYYAEGTVFDAAGTMYTLPMVKSTEVLYYNKTFFENNNLTVPTTWDELEAVCAQILAIDGDCIPLGYDSESNWFITMTEQYNSNYTSTTGTNFLFNNKTNRTFVREFRDWYDKGYFTTQELYGAYTSALFTTQGCYMCIGSSAGANHQIPEAVDGVVPFQVGIAPIPQVDKNDPAAISQGPSLCIFDSDNKQEVVASWLFVKFLTTNPEFQASFSITSGYIPVIERDVLVEAVPYYGEWLTKGSPIASAISIAFDQSDAYFASPAFNGSSKARDTVGKLMQYCFTTQAADIDAMIAQAFKDAVAECVADA